MTGSRRHLNDRLTDNDPELIRLDITASALVDFSRWEKDDFIASIQTNKTVKHVHLSGDGLENCLSSQQIELLLDAIGYMENLEELFIFKGNNREVSGDRISALLKLAHKLKVSNVDIGVGRCYATVRCWFNGHRVVYYRFPPQLLTLYRLYFTGLYAVGLRRDGDGSGVGRCHSSPPIVGTSDHYVTDPNEVRVSRCIRHGLCGDAQSQVPLHSVQVQPG